MKPRLVQALCGPERHCILALPYEPGLTAAQADFGSCDDITLTETNAADYVRGTIDRLIERKAINPWCAICRSRRERWSFEDSPLPFDTLQEAMPTLKQSERDQMDTATFLKGTS